MSNRVLIVGSGAREHAIASALARSDSEPKLFVFASGNNPGMMKVSSGYHVGNINSPEDVSQSAVDWDCDFAVIGPEAPLGAGVSDALWKKGIPVVGPKKELAQLETDKAFTRDLLKKHSVGGSPRYKHFDSMDGVEEFLEELGDAFVIKANGLKGGKGVKVSGDHLFSIQEGIDYCNELVEDGASFVIEEKMIGVEFSLISLCGGKTLLHMPTVQDHKRAFVGDKGPNTGGMGSYSDSDHGLPFLSDSDIGVARQFNEKVAAALLAETGMPYQGVLYGGFMATSKGPMIVEYNARFGDPECLNLMSLLEDDLAVLFKKLLADELPSGGSFANTASVCKYLVPEGYPEAPLKDFEFGLGDLSEQVDCYFGAVDERNGKLFGTASRTLALVACGETIGEAERLVEQEISKITGPMFHREDIGTGDLINQRINTMKNLRV